jgi:hypothetical protein
MDHVESQHQQQQQHSSRWRPALSTAAIAAAALPETVYGAAVHVKHVAQQRVWDSAINKASQISEQFVRAPRHVLAGHLNEVQHAASFYADAIRQGTDLRWVLCSRASSRLAHQTLGSPGQLPRRADQSML